MSWSPAHALAEILERRAMYVARGDLMRLDHPPHERRYRARCGDREVEAMIVPHEECVTLGHRFAPVECAFCYAIPEAASAALARHPDRRPDAWETQMMYPPHEARLAGGDRVGVLLCSRRHGELWVGFDTSHAAAARYGTNATLLQTAAGVIAGWTLLGAQPGIHVVEELDWRAYLAVVETILGPRQVHVHPGAPVRALADRRC
jgi:homospermidine synthase